MTAITTIKTWQDSYLRLMTRVEEPVVELTARASEAIAEYERRRGECSRRNWQRSAHRF